MAISQGGGVGLVVVTPEKTGGGAARRFFNTIVLFDNVPLIWPQRLAHTHTHTFHI